MHRQSHSNRRNVRGSSNSSNASYVVELSALRNSTNHLTVEDPASRLQNTFFGRYVDLAAQRSLAAAPQNMSRHGALQIRGNSQADTASTASSEYVRHHRYEDPYTAYQLVSEPYDLHREVQRQQRFINDNRRLGIPFVIGGGKALEKPTRYLLGDCVAALYRTIARDWAETAPVVISTAEDLIVVYMKRSRVRNTETVLRYMNTSLKRNEAVRAFDLRKVPEGWDVLTDDGHMMYTFRPPWVRSRRFLPDQVVTRKRILLRRLTRKGQ